VLLSSLVGIQFIPTGLNQSDNFAPNDFLTLYEAPLQIQKLIKNSCYDCHSNNTSYPWYSKIQPGAWFMERHINHGKSELNLNEFGLYSARKRKAKIKSAIRQIDGNNMPLFSYSILHPNSRLSKDDKEKLTDWLNHVRHYPD